MSGQEKVGELLVRWDELREQGQEVPPEKLCADSPELLDDLKRQIMLLKSMDWLDRPVEEPHASANGRAGHSGPGLTVPPPVGGRHPPDGPIAAGGFGQGWPATDPRLPPPAS